MRKYSLIILLLVCANLTAQDDRVRNTIKAENTFSVTIGGNFPVTGTFPSYINERVDQFITRLYNEAALSLRPWEVVKFSFRNIKLKRINGDEMNLDLLKFRRTGDFALNPYLQHDDVLIFPSTDIERNFVSIAGAIMKPGKFHFVEGDKVKDIVELAGGYNKAYENVKTKVYRLNYSGTKTDIIEASEDFILERGDRIVLQAEETNKKDYNIFVVGAVNSPGEIPISQHNTTLGEVIERAGGLKANAYLKNSRLYTGSKSEYILNYVYGYNFKDQPFDAALEEKLTNELVELERIRMYRLSGLTYEDTTYFGIEDKLRILTEGSTVDFEKEFQSYIVKNGDILVIAEKPTTVYLFGSVVNSGHINFNEGKDAYHYVNQAGGFSEYAERDEIMLIKGNTREWIPVEEHNPVIEPGDYIFVPKDEPRPFSYYVDLTSKYFGIIGSVATVILLFSQFGSN